MAWRIQRKISGQEQNEKGLSSLVFATPRSRNGNRGLWSLGTASARISHQRGRRVGGRRPGTDRRSGTADRRWPREILQHQLRELGGLLRQRRAPLSSQLRRSAIRLVYSRGSGSVCPRQ